MTPCRINMRDASCIPHNASIISANSAGKLSQARHSALVVLNAHADDAIARMSSVCSSVI
jgi:hypothetical protein